MKRKLEEDEESSPVSGPNKLGSPKQTGAEPSFAELGLDPRLLQAIAAQNFKKPTAVQHKAVPLALDGQDVLVRAQCGSGKTMVYVLSILSSILGRKSVRSSIALAAVHQEC